MFTLEIALDFIYNLTFSVSFSLEDPKSSYCVSPACICLTNSIFEIFVLVSVTHNVNLELTIHLISHVFSIDQTLHICDILLAHIVLLNEISSVSVDSVQFLENKVESALQ